MKTRLVNTTENNIEYQSLMFICPGCVEFGGSGLHDLPVNSKEKSPSWDFNGDLEKPTLSPSIKSVRGKDKICHSFLRDGMFEFLPDSTHSLSGQNIPIPDLPDWLSE